MVKLFKKYLHGKSTTIISAAVIIATASLASRFLGIIRDRILAGEFGAGNELDIYYAAFRIPDLVYNLTVAGALSAGFIPIFAELINGRQNPRHAWQIANGVLNFIFIGLAILCVGLAIGAPWLVPLITPGFEGEKLALTIELTQIMLLSPFFLGLSSLFGAVLQTYKRFMLYSLAPILYNLGIIFGALFLVNIWGLAGLAYGVVIGAVLHLLIQIPGACKLGWRYEFIWPWHDVHIRKIITLTIPRILSLGVSQINMIFITAIASLLVAGSIAVYNLANNLQYFPVGIIGFSFAIAALPTLSEFVAEKAWDKYKKAFSNTARDILFLSVPASLLLLLLRAQIVRVILGSGRFTWVDTILTADTLAFFSLSLFAQCLIPLLMRMFFAIKNTVIPLVVAVSSALLNIILAFLFAKSIGVAGLALAFSVAMIFNLILLWVALRIKVGYLYELPILRSLYKICVAAIAMAVVIQLTKYLIAPFLDFQTFIGIFLHGAISGTLGIIVYCLITFILRSPEMLNMIASVRRKFFKKYYEPREGVDMPGHI